MTTPTGVLFQNPIVKPISSSGLQQAGCTATFYLTGTTTLTPIYSDGALTVPLNNPLSSDASGAFVPIYMDPNVIYRVILKTQGGSLISDTDPFVPASSGALTPTALGKALYPQTPQEITASVAPTIYVPSLQIDLERYGGGVGATASANNAALTSALAVIAAKGGGVLVARGSGTYSFSSTFNTPSGLIVQGDGYGTIWNYTGAGSFLTVPANGGRSELRELQVTGTGQTGVGFTLGDASGSPGLVTLRKVLFEKWATAMRMGGATWLTAEKCEFGRAAGGTAGILVTTNNVGIDFNYFGGNNYSSVILFKDCVVSNNANAGVQATNVPVTMNEVTWLNCNVQNNCQGTPANPQFYMGAVAGFSIDSMYMEYLGSGTVPDAIKSDNLNNGQIRSVYISAAANGIKDRGGGSMNHVEIVAPQIFGITTGKAIDCVSETDVRVRYPQITGAVQLTGTGCEVISASFLTASWPVDEASFTPVLTPASGTITQVSTGTYSRVGNVVHWQSNIAWSAIAGASGVVTVTGLPVVAKAGAQNVAVAVGVFNGITVPTLSQLTGQINNGTGTIALLFSQATFANVTTAALASSGQLSLSGSYQV